MSTQRRMNIRSRPISHMHLGVGLTHKGRSKKLLACVLTSVLQLFPQTPVTTTTNNPKKTTMGAFYETIPQSLFDWILAQKIFWVATAPLSPTGHVNISPKGGAYFGLLPDARTFWYLDLTGSGSETIAHLYERGNGRITVLFNAFSGPPRILRIFGHGRVLEKAAAAGAGGGGGGFDEFVKAHGLKSEQVDVPGARAIVVVDVHQVGTSCGYSVPFFEYREHRNTLNEFFARKEGKFREGNEAESMPR